MRGDAEPDVTGSSTDVAVIKTVGRAGTWDGAVYMPDVEIVPHSAPVQPGPAAVQITRLSSAFWTVAVNPKIQPTGIVGSGGETVTTTAARMVIGNRGRLRGVSRGSGPDRHLGGAGNAPGGCEEAGAADHAARGAAASSAADAPYHRGIR